MQSLEQIVKQNGTTKADIEGGSFTLTEDGIRVPIFAGTVVEQIDEIEKAFDAFVCPESRAEEWRTKLGAALTELDNQ